MKNKKNKINIYNTIKINLESEITTLIDNHSYILSDTERKIYHFFKNNYLKQNKHDKYIEDYIYNLNMLNIMLKKKIKKNYYKYDNIKKRIKELENIYNENIDLFSKKKYDNEKIKSCFDLNSEELYKNYNYLEDTISSSIKLEKDIQIIYKYFNKIIPYLNDDKFKELKMEIDKLNTYDYFNCEHILDYLNEVKLKEKKEYNSYNINEIKKKLLEKKLKLTQYNEIFYDSNLQDHYQKIIKCKSNNIENLLFINVFTNNMINNKQK